MYIFPLVSLPHRPIRFPSDWSSVMKAGYQGWRLRAATPRALRPTALRHISTELCPAGQNLGAGSVFASGRSRPVLSPQTCDLVSGFPRALISPSLGLHSRFAGELQVSAFSGCFIIWIHFQNASTFHVSSLLHIMLRSTYYI